MFCKLCLMLTYSIGHPLCQRPALPLRHKKSAEGVTQSNTESEPNTHTLYETSSHVKKGAWYSGLGIAPLKMLSEARYMLREDQELLAGSVPVKLFICNKCNAPAMQLHMSCITVILRVTVCYSALQHCSVYSTNLPVHLQ